MIGTLSATDRPGRDLPVLRASSWVRAVFWDQALRLVAGGVGSSGAVPVGPAVVVANHANHASHADTAALTAVLGKRSPVLAVAGGDYWNGWRGRLAAGVIGILPISRQGGFEALREGAGAHLARGGIVVLFPEGTRSTTGEVGEFRSGAVRLAAATGVPVIPVGITGTAQLFGKGHRFPDLAAAARTPIGVRIGDPVSVDPDHSATEVTDAVRDQVCALAGEPAPAVTASASWEWARSRLSGRRGVAFTFGWAFAEGLVFPIVAEAGVLPVALAHGRRCGPAIGASVAGSVAGAMTNWALARAGVRVPWPLTTPDMHAAARRGLAENVPAALRQQRGNGIPVKVYARLAGESGVPARTLLPAVATARAARIVPVGIAMAAVGEVTRRRTRVAYGATLACAGVGVAVGLELVIRSWKRYR